MDNSRNIEQHSWGVTFNPNVSNDPDKIGSRSMLYLIRSFRRKGYTGSFEKAWSQHVEEWRSGNAK